MRILVIDDEREIVELLEIYLRKEGYQIVKAYDGKMGLKKFQEVSDIKMAIIDIMMPKMDGISVMRELRTLQDNLPILLLSAKGSDTDKIAGLTLGADDYVVKPFHPLEIVARVKSLLKRYQQPRIETHEIIDLGSIQIDKNAHEVKTPAGNTANLTVLEFGILHLLASHLDRVFTADEIFQQVWQQDSSVSTKTVMVHVSHLRDKLESITGGEKIVETVWGVGYKISKN